MNKNKLKVKNIIIFSSVIFFCPLTLFSQSETILKKYFEGKMVVVQIDMPATKDGVDVHPLEDQPIDYYKYGDKLKKNGTAIYAGERIMVTKVKTRGKHIEFHLNGGGYGTLSDDSPYVYVPYVPKSNREKNLEKAVKAESNSQRKIELQEELDDLKRERELEERKLRMEAQQQTEQRKVHIREQAKQGGSRFNIRFDRDLTTHDKTPDAVLEALKEFVDFPFLRRDAEVTAEESMTPQQPRTLRKGLLWEDVMQLMGAPQSLVERMEGRLKVISCTFIKEDQEIQTEFVEGVLIKYTISSK